MVILPVDFSSGVYLSNSFHGCEGTTYRVFNKLHSRLGYKRFNSNSVNWKDKSSKRINKKTFLSSSRLYSSLVSNGGLPCGYSDHSLFSASCVASRLSTAARRNCQGNDSLAFDNGNGRNIDSAEDSGGSSKTEFTDTVMEAGEEKEADTLSLDELRELLHKAMKELEVARLNSTMFEEKAQQISEAAIALKDDASSAWSDVNAVLDVIQQIVNEESVAKEAVQKATMSLSLAEARLKVATESLETSPEETLSLEESTTSDIESNEHDQLILAAQKDIKECQENLLNCEADLKQLQNKKDELQQEVDRLKGVADRTQMDALKAEEEVGNIMLLAEQAVAFEIEATKRVNDAEIALHRAEKSLSGSNLDTSETTQGHMSGAGAVIEEGFVDEGSNVDIVKEIDMLTDGDVFIIEPAHERLSDKTSLSAKDIPQTDEICDQENGHATLERPKDSELEVEKSKKGAQVRKQDLQKEAMRESSPSPFNAQKASLNKSSRFFPASFFSFTADGTELTPTSVFQSFMNSAKDQLPKLVVGLLLIGGGVAFYTNRLDRSSQMLQRPEIVTSSVEEVPSSAKPVTVQIKKFSKKVKQLLAKLPHQEAYTFCSLINEEEASLFDMLWLLLASVIFVPIFQKIPGGSPVLGYLAAGILIGPYGLSIIRHVHGTKAIAEFGVVFLLFNIGLELSVERLSSMKKYVFGLGSAQVLVTAIVAGLAAHFFAGVPGPAAIVIGNGLALSSTAVVLQVLQERGESTSRHGRATFSVLLFQDLAVVVLLILIPLISPNSSKGGVGFQAIAEALGLAAVKAAVAITAIIAGGRLLLRPIYKQIAENQNAEIFSANTLLVILGTSLLTARAGLSMALGAFLAGLLLAETEFSLQVESDIAPYRGLLLGLFFMTVGMSIDPKLLFSNFPVIMGTLGLLIVGKTLLVALVGRLFGVSLISAIRVGLLLAPGGEFAFVAFGEAVNQSIMSPQLSSLLFLVVGISMAITPWLAAGGQLIASRFELHDVRSLLPVESETDDLQGHIIICGFGRVGQIIAQLLSERLIPFVALDVRSDRVAVGRALDLPVYFGDAGSREVLHKVGAERACAAAITLDSPGANYRTVWALSKHFPNVKTFVRAHDVDHGLNLEKAGASAVVPETLEPSLQLAAAVLAQAKLPTSEIAATINEFRSRHLSELTELCEASGSSLGYGFSRVMSKPKSGLSDDENQTTEGTLAI
ncbi:K(+) efflux antiporter 2, chloroplastic [Linum grandiflorum]